MPKPRRHSGRTATPLCLTATPCLPPRAALAAAIAGTTEKAGKIFVKRKN